ncbi:MAG TPA: acetyl-CoA carboxylase biotin carboxyl carrier protein [Jatrophihabitantaceae bacterium]|jgi:acetyl-CoA carboxylase biotin carboxyl carrier protein
MSDVTLGEIKELVRTFTESRWVSLELDIGGTHLVLGRDGAPVTRAAPPSSVAIAETAPAPAAAGPMTVVEAPEQLSGDPEPVPGKYVDVRSPAVGAFWVAPSPGEPPFVEVGQTIEADQQLGIVEVMKLMNHISAPCAGTVVKVCVANAQMVEFDQVLFLIEPADA